MPDEIPDELRIINRMKAYDDGAPFLLPIEWASFHRKLKTFARDEDDMPPNLFILGCDTGLPYKIQQLGLQLYWAMDRGRLDEAFAHLDGLADGSINPRDRTERHQHQEVDTMANNTRRPSPMDRFLRSYDKMRLPCEPDLPASPEEAEGRVADEQPVDLMDRHLMALLKTRRPMAPDTHDEKPDADAQGRNSPPADLEGGSPSELKPECRPSEDTMRRLRDGIAEGVEPLPPKPRSRQ